MTDEFPFRVFDPQEDVLTVQRKLPHWSQAGTIAFITFRTWDSMPVAVIRQWLDQRSDWLGKHGINSADPDWKHAFEGLLPRLQQEFHRRFSERWQTELDNCHGQCVLRHAKFAQVVANSLKYFDGDRYELTDFVVMPNHVHLLAAFQDAGAMLQQCESCKHFTAVQINRQLNRQGRFWQQDGFDHLVRSADQFEYLRGYIAQNPIRAKLPDGHYLHRSKKL